MVRTKARKWGPFLFAATFLSMSALIVSRNSTNGKERKEEMVRVPHGKFVMGSNEEEAKVFKDVFGEKTPYKELKGQRTVYVTRLGKLAGIF